MQAQAQPQRQAQPQAQLQERRHGREPPTQPSLRLSTPRWQIYFTPHPGSPGESRERRTVWSVRRPVKPEVAGSNPVVPASRISNEARLLGQVAQSVERRSEKPEVDGSTPSLTTTRIVSGLVVFSCSVWNERRAVVAGFPADLPVAEFDDYTNVEVTLPLIGL